MSKRTKKPLNQDLIDQWPEILKDVNLSAIPIFYLHSVVITFKDKNVWNVILKKEDKELNGERFTETLNELLQNYNDEIVHVDFRLDIEHLKKDIIRITKKFTKRKK